MKVSNGKNIKQVKKEASSYEINNDNIKKYKIYLKGLNCSNCAAKIENDVRKITGVESADINLIKQEFNIKASLKYEVLFENIKSIVLKYEPDVKVLDDSAKVETKGCSSCCAEGHCADKEHNDEDGHDHGDNDSIKTRLIKYVIGLSLFLGAVFIDLPETYSDVILIISYLIFGYDVLIRAVKNILRGQVFDENFLMSISTVGAILIGELPEAVFVMLFYQVGEMFQDIAVGRSRKSIKDLMNIKPEYANIKTESGFEKVSPDSVRVNDIIIVKPGEKIPLDGVVIEGSGQIDTVALTGESVPRIVKDGDEVLNGSINIDGVLNIKVTKEFGESTVMKILEMVENAANKKSKAEQFITKFAKIYTPIVVILAALLAFIPPIVTPEADLAVWISRALIFLVVSCPCALVLSVPLGFFSGIGAASKNGILVKGSNYIQALSVVDTVVFDKTGTVTEGVFRVSEFVNKSGLTDEQLLNMVRACEKMSNHPIAKSIVGYVESLNIKDDIKLTDFKEIRGYGLEAYINDTKILLGNAKLMKKEDIVFEQYEGLGSVVYIAIDNKYAGRISVSDKIKTDTKKAVDMFKQLGINDIIMLTGDNKTEAAKVCQEVGIKQFYAELLPQGKVEKIEELYEKSNYRNIAFVGDGINDAPVLSRVEVGVAMGGVGSDAAIEAADMVIMNDSLVKVAEGIVISRNTISIVKQNIIFALGVKFIVLILGALGMASMWAAVFADVGVSFICILNSMRRKIK